MKRLITLVLLLTVLGCSHSGPYKLYDQAALPAAQQLELELPKAVDLEQLDGVALKLAFNPAEQRQYHLLPGRHRLALRYVSVWQDEMGNVEVVKSKLVGIEVEGAAGTRLQLATPLPTTLAEAKRFAKEIQLALRDSAGRLTQGQLLPEPHQPAGTLDVLFNDKGSAYEHLTTWWQEANEQERAMFREYIEHHP